MNKKKISVYIRNKRKEAAISQRDLAKLIVNSIIGDYRDDLMLVSNYEKKIYRWESEKSFISAYDLIIISQVFGVTMDALVKQMC